VGYEQPIYRRDETSDEVHLDTAVILWINQWLYF
jgi:3-deoxy-D-arabino-heptulosonate 7-phosphate (DAHP) synthase class II